MRARMARSWMRSHSSSGQWHAGHMLQHRTGPTCSPVVEKELTERLFSEPANMKLPSREKLLLPIWLGWYSPTPAVTIRQSNGHIRHTAVLMCL